MQEGLPNVVMEASACGRAVLGSNTAGIPEIIRNGETGLLVPPGEVMAWKNALITYATKIDQLGIMGQRARARMEALFDSKQYRHGIMDLYRTVMSERLSNPNVQDHG
jgi:glycosyltransferase involved in cell wall biosynthesis